MTVTTTGHQILYLDWKEKNNRVVITPADQDRFMLTVSEAIIACQVGEQHEKFGKQFHVLLQTLARWIKQNLDKIKGAHVSIRDAGLLFLVVRQDVQYDDDFEDSLSELDIRIAQDPNLDLVKISVLAVPNASTEATASFLRPGFSWTYRHAK